jgi:hypothetical protein
MSQDILITPGSGEPQILFRGSGTTDTAVELNVLSSYQSATGSGTALLFEGEEGLLFGITDNLSSGTIFSVSDITGLPAIEYDASGDLKLGEYANSTTLYADRGVYLATGIPTNTTNAIYISGGALHFNGGTVGGYDDTAISGYFESRVDQNAADIITVSGLSGGGGGSVVGATGTFEQINLTSSGNVIPNLLMTGSGVTDTPIRMKVLSSHASASTSGTAISFEGTEGQLFGITDNLSSGNIFSVNDITGLPIISVDASGDLKLGQFGRYLQMFNLPTSDPGVSGVIWDSGQILRVSYG